MNRHAILFLAAVIQLFSSAEPATSFELTSPEENIRERNRRDSDSSDEKASLIQAEFGETYIAKLDAHTSYSYQYSEKTNESLAVRLFVSSVNSKEAYPVLFVVKEQRSVLSWQVPLLLENIYDYYNVSRTLCPVNPSDKSLTQYQDIIVDVSAMSKSPVQFSLRAELVYMKLETNTPKLITVNPSEPKYYKYVFPSGLDTVRVELSSQDRLCAIFSVQDIHCPVYDLVRNVEFTGIYQTVTKLGAITVSRDDYKEYGSFFIVVVIKPTDYECLGIDRIKPSDGGTSRTKQVELVVKPAVSTDDFIWAVFGAVAWFLMFYLLSLFICFIYACAGKNTNAQELQTLVDGDDEEERASLLGGPRTPTPTNPDQPIYGATGGVDGPAGPSMDKEFDGTNGIPHRIAPPDEGNSDDSSVDENDIDMLHDIDHEKDIFRTKTYLYVADLARKPRKVLAKKYKLYHWNLLTLAIFYGLPVIQLVITYQTVLHVTGNEDICYYNFKCSHPFGVLSAFNNVFSNIGYVLLGILFLILVARRDLMHKRMMRQNDRLDKYYGIPQHYGVFYAMGIALAMEGILSGCYHVCPSYSNFQFDTAFMYVIAWLTMLKIYQSRHPDINAHAHTAYFAIAFVILLAVLGVFESGQAFMIAFTVLYILTCAIFSIYIYYNGRYRLDCGVFRRIYQLMRADRLHCMKPMYVDRMILLIIGNLVNWSFAIYGLVKEPRDFASYLLAIFIVNLLMYFAFYIIMKLRSKERILWTPLVFTLIASVLWAAAFYFFFSRLSSWQKTPALSRESNKNCLILNFYDEHDVWHFLSAMSMFFSFMVLLTLDDDLIYTPRDKIPVF